MNFGDLVKGVQNRMYETYAKELHHDQTRHIFNSIVADPEKLTQERPRSIEAVLTSQKIRMNDALFKRNLRISYCVMATHRSIASYN